MNQNESTKTYIAYRLSCHENGSGSRLNEKAGRPLPARKIGKPAGRPQLFKRLLAALRLV